MENFLKEFALSLMKFFLLFNIKLQSYTFLIPRFSVFFCLVSLIQLLWSGNPEGKGPNTAWNLTHLTKIFFWYLVGEKFTTSFLVFFYLLSLDVVIKRLDVEEEGAAAAASLV